jgi:hypothetical protein
MRNRQKQRENRKKQGEESLNTRNESGYRDLTPLKAVERIMGVKKDGSIKA